MPASNVSTLTAANVMTRNPRVLDANSPVLDAVLIFREFECGAVPVYHEGQLAGVITDRDVALALAEHADDLRSLPIGAIAAPGYLAVPPEMPLERVVEEFGAKGVRRLMVLDAGLLVGIIGWADVAPHVTDTRVGRAVKAVVTTDAPS